LGGRGEALTGGEVASNVGVSTEVLLALACVTVGIGGGARAGGVGGSAVDVEWASCWAVTADAGRLFVSASGCGDSAGAPEKHGNTVSNIDCRARGIRQWERDKGDLSLGSEAAPPCIAQPVLGD
jgi:hypothetical protein